MTPDLTQAPNVNALWAGLLVEELVRQGVGLFVVCPGSRSAPLAVAVANAAAAGRCEWLVHADERAAAFVALGWGRATGRPAAVVTTSGTAVANLLPAAVEADAAGVPLLLLTADRPPELRDTGANQTIRQPGLFSHVVRWAFDVPPPTADVDPAFVLSTAAHAAARSLAPAGPVHLNLAFREPLGAQPDGTDAAARLAPLRRWTGSPSGRDLPYTRTDAGGSPTKDTFQNLANDLRVERGLVVLGPTDVPGLARAAADLAQRLGWPLLPDVGSQARVAARPEATAHYDLALASDAFAEANQPDAVVHVGGRPVSKRLLALVDRARPDPYLVIQASPERFDPSHLVTNRFVGDPGYGCGALAQHLPAPGPPSAWLGGWQRATAAAVRAATEEIGRDLSEPFVAQAVASRLPDRGGLVLAASMPIRDVDAFAPADGHAIRVFANRGASGIDGTVATAHGVACGMREPVILLIGDLAMLHDQTSLMLLRSGPPVVVVVVNNDGGGIFHQLPVAHGPHAVDAETFEAVFGTPHGLTFEHAAAQVGLAYHAPATADAFEAALDGALASGASAVIEVRTDRAESAALRARLLDAVRQSVDATLEP